MKTQKELKENFGKLTEDQKKKVQIIMAELKNLVETNKINEAGLRSISNIELEVSSLKESYLWRTIKLLKQGHMVD
jgi:hypothetical protein